MAPELDLELDLTKTYVYDNAEVKLTGRVAVRELQAPRAALRGGRAAGRRVALVEVTPVNDGGWARWVEPHQLFTIVEVAREGG
jgi:hypothetical protein